MIWLDKLEAYSLELIRLVESNCIKTRRQLNEAKIRLCTKHKIASMPSNAIVLSFVKNKTDRLLSLLRVKPTRSLSGIAVVAIMSKPYKCPGNCIYCPSSLLPAKQTPKSYTGKEPATMRALSANFSPLRQVRNRLLQLQEAGHSTDKVELIVMGGTFLSQPKQYQHRFMLSSINALCDTKAKTLALAKKAAEKSSVRIAGITFETRPDFCGKMEINRMLRFGGTRCELGVQTVYDEVYKKIGRGHSIAHVVSATTALKDSAFKVTYHYMPGLPCVSLAEDKRALRTLFKNPLFRPDNLKIYPCLVIKGTELHSLWKQGKYKPFSTRDSIKLLSYAKPFFPRWVRVMRIQRDIPSQLISAGVKKSNLRQLVQEHLHSKAKKCNCIRCREAGLLLRGKELGARVEGAKLFAESYEASLGKEFFISLEDEKRQCLFGFARLRFPSRPFRREISPSTALLRALRVFGVPLPLHARKQQAIQHRGLGKMLLQKAEEIALNEFDSKKLLVISGFGVKPYYYAQGFKQDGCFVSKRL